MKAVEATIPAAQLDEVANLLFRIGAEALTMTEARRFGRADGRRNVLRGSAHELDSVPTIHIEVVIDDAMVNPVVDAILTAARWGGGGEGQVLISSVHQVLRIGHPKRLGRSSGGANRRRSISCARS